MLLHCTAFGAHRMEMVKTAVSAVSNRDGWRARSKCRCVAAKVSGKRVQSAVSDLQRFASSCLCWQTATKCSKRLTAVRLPMTWDFLDTAKKNTKYFSYDLI